MRILKRSPEKPDVQRSGCEKAFLLSRWKVVEHQANLGELSLYQRNQLGKYFDLSRRNHPDDQFRRFPLLRMDGPLRCPIHLRQYLAGLAQKHFAPCG